jgi:hypothetical protein
MSPADTKPASPVIQPRHQEPGPNPPVSVRADILGAVPAGPRSSALQLMAGVRFQPLSRSAVEHERRHARAQTPGLLTHLPRAAHPLNSPHGTDDAVPRVLPSATPYGDLARNLVSRPRTREGEALPEESAGRGIRLRPGRTLWMRPLFSHPVNPRNAADTKAPPHRVERATDPGAFR